MKIWPVKINIDSIQKNPNAGNEITHIPGAIEWSFRAKVLPSYFVDGINCIIREWGINPTTGKMQDVIGYITSAKLLDRIAHEQPSGLQLQMDRDILRVEHFPEPEYFYEYEDTRVICDHCGEILHIKDLRDDSFWDGGEVYLLMDICPNCGESPAVELEYESIDEAIIRKNEP